MNNQKLTTFSPSKPLNAAVLFLVFNRLDTTKQVFEAIREAKPPRLYFASDGARESREGEAEKVLEIRQYITSNIDWDCEVKTLFRKKNLGCKMAVSTAIDWFFKNEEMGIILEDDCLPSQSFFFFCEELLIRYKEDTRIGHIGGTNPLSNSLESNSYYFSRYNRIWGWASWRRSWDMFDVELTDWPEIKEKKLLNKLLYTKKEADTLSNTLDQIYNGSIDTWDYQWFLSRLLTSKAIIPSVNLISNLGFDKEATHTFDESNPLANMKRGKVTFPLQHPKYIIEDFDLDLQWSNFLTKKKNIIQKIGSVIKRK